MSFKFSSLKAYYPFVFFLLFIICSCTPYRKLGKINEASSTLSMNLPGEEELEKKQQEVVKKVISDSTVKGDPLIMNAIRDEQTGEMVATDVIVASKVTARFRHIAERFGKISLEFDISVPQGITDSRWQARFYPILKMMGDSTNLEPLYVTGSRYREAQLRGYERYNAFLASIIRDSSALLYLDQLETFLERNFPQTYAMKSDTTIISEPLAEDLFGVTQAEALEHYKRRLLIKINNRKIGRKAKMYSKYVKDPFKEGIRLDTVFTGDDGSLVYRYTQELQSRPGLKKITLSMDASLYEYGKKLCDMPRPEDLVFYVSSLSTLYDKTVRYMTKVIERNAYDRTLALIDFALGRSDIDSTLGSNASELRRIEKSIEAIISNEDFELDSVVVTASCSPEGSFRHNSRLAASRAKSMKNYLAQGYSDFSERLRDKSVPENWDMLHRLIASDSLLTNESKTRLLAITDSQTDEDARELRLSKCPEYKYLRENVYPYLRTVQLEFYTHRAGMIKDTIHTTEPDTVYMAGIEALRNLDYAEAATRLRPYKDYNAALALTAMSYNHTALDILEGLDQDNASVLYLRAIVLSRLGQYVEALESWQKSVELDGSMLHRANLDPEISDLTKLALLRK